MNLQILAFLLISSSSFIAASGQKYNAMFSFGDSLSDTGNFCVNKSGSSELELTIAQPPYGMTYFGHPTCRCSDGRLVVDFLAQALGLPLLPPSKVKSTDFRKGANMAIVGGTTLDFSFLQSIGLGYPIWNTGAMNIQIQWFQQLMPSICGTPQNCKAYLAKALFIFGELGGNDYNAMLFFGFTIDQTRKYIPKIVDTLSSGVEKLISLGAVDIVVPGALPIGCFSLYLTMIPSSNKDEYDQYGCLKTLNDLSTYHNSLLQNRLASLQSKYKSTRIMYADYYSQIFQMVQNPEHFGFSTAIAACCGAGGGKYNFEFNARCGMKGASACSNPSSHECWDGVHPTEAVNKLTADSWLKGPYCHPPILH